MSLKDNQAHPISLSLCFLVFEGGFLYFHFLTLQQKTIYDIQPDLGNLYFFRTLLIHGSVCITDYILHFAFLRRKIMCYLSLFSSA